MFIVGLTGGLATGKSTVLSIFRENGIAVIDADEVARTGTQLISYYKLLRRLPLRLHFYKILFTLNCKIWDCLNLLFGYYNVTHIKANYLINIHILVSCLLLVYS